MKAGGIYAYLFGFLCLASGLDAHYPKDFAQRLESIAFGSCNRDTLPQPLWPVIAENNPDLWIWGGDNVYADWPNRLERTPPQDAYAAWIAERYNSQLQNPAYSQFREQIPILGTWDDHDYGRNNALSDFPLKEVSSQLALDFMDVPAVDPRRHRDGIYGAYDFGPEGEIVKVILLDNRYFANSPDSEKPELLGEVQRAWLYETLKSSQASIHLFVSGSQLISSEHKWDKWSNYPKDTAWLMETLSELKIPGVIFLSGDRHIHEISVLEDSSLSDPIMDVTSSGLTHFWENYPGEPNRYRKGPVYAGLGFGLIKIKWEPETIEVTAEIRNQENRIENTYSVRFMRLN